MALLDLPVLYGAVLAWSLAAPPGPANALMAQEAARRSYSAGFLTGLGACAGDLLMFALMGLGVLRIVDANPWSGVVLAGAGFALMTKFAWDAWRAARRHPHAEAEGRGSFGRSFAIVVTSPFNWAWWLTAGTTLFADLGWSLMIGFFAGLVLWVAVWVGMARVGARRFERFEIIVAYGSAFLLVAFAAIIGWIAATRAWSLVA